MSTDRFSWFLMTGDWWLLTCRGVGRSDTQRWKWHNYNGSSMAIHVQFVKVESENLELTHVFYIFFMFFRSFPIFPSLPNGLEYQSFGHCDWSLCQLMVCRATVTPLSTPVAAAEIAPGDSRPLVLQGDEVKLDYMMDKCMHPIQSKKCGFWMTQF